MNVPRSAYGRAQGPLLWLATLGVLVCVLPALSGQPAIAIEPVAWPRPLTGVLASAAWLVPLGPHALRVELLAAVCVAVASAIVCHLAVSLWRARPAVASAFALILAWLGAAGLLRGSLESLTDIAPSVLVLSVALLALFSHARTAARRRGAFVLGLVTLLLGLEAPRALLALPVLLVLYYGAFVLLRLRAGSERAPGSLAPLGALRTLALLLGLLLAFLLLRDQARAHSVRTAARDPVRDLLADALERELPARSLTFASETLAAGLARLHREQATRPDRSVVSLAVLADARATTALVRAEPELAGVLRAHVLLGQLDAPELQSLATRKPVQLFAAPSVLVHASLQEVLLPARLYAQVSSSAAISSDLKAAAQAHARAWRALEASFPADRTLLDTATRRVLREHALVRGLLLSPLERGHSLTEALLHARAWCPTPEERAELHLELRALGLSGDLL